jgi:hypothetical protein
MGWCGIYGNLFIINGHFFIKIKALNYLLYSSICHEAEHESSKIPTDEFTSEFSNVVRG